MSWWDGIGDWPSNIWSVLHGMSADAWAASAGWTTAVIAGLTVAVAGKYAARQVEEAKNQVREAQQTRNEEAQPNVVVFAESDRTHWNALELVVKNFGSTPAYDVRLQFDKQPQVSDLGGGGGIHDLWYPEVIHVLAPWQEWRTFWDHAPSRLRCPDLASRYQATVSFKDSHGNPLETKSVLDWDSMKGVTRMETKTVHDVANLLKKQNEVLERIAKTLSAFGNPRQGVWVFGADAIQELQDRNEQAEENQRELEQMMGQLFRRPPAQPDPQQGQAEVAESAESAPSSDEAS